MFPDWTEFKVGGALLCLHPIGEKTITSMAL